jgi:murein DD-endopeptidase MepM/ murein hydrolase activator NlpD
MKRKKHKSILIVPPSGSGIRSIGIPTWVFIAIMILIAGGFVGYFIPFNNYTLDVVEKNQKRNLDDQNNRLLSYVRPMRKFFDNLGDKVEGLERKKLKISTMLGIGESENKRIKKSKNLKPALLSLDEITGVVVRNYSLFSGVVQANKDRGDDAYFNTIPIIKPVLDSALIAARFGKEKDPFTETGKMHYGIDFIASRGAPVVATASGVVAKVEDGRVWGHRIFVTHAHGFETVYAHLGTVETVAGRKVKKGDQIGTAGLSGLTTGVHVHYEIWHDGKPENPEDYFFPEFAVSN